MVRQLGQTTLGIVRDTGDFTLFCGRAFLSLSKTRRLPRRILRAVYEQGAVCLPVIAIVGVFTLTGLICAAVLLCGGFLITRASGAENSRDFELLVLVLFLVTIFARQMFRGAENDPLRAMSYTVFGLFYIPWLFSFITKIIYLTPRLESGMTTGQWYVLYLVAVTKFSDMGAYVFGSLFGKHPFAPHISPKKTWEGFFGALFSSLLCSFWMYALMPEKLSAFRFDDIVFLGLLLGFAAVVGDLAESIVKRGAHTKDSSAMLPGIGGTLDLIDSILRLDRPERAQSGEGYSFADADRGDVGALERRGIGGSRAGISRSEDSSLQRA